MTSISIRNKSSCQSRKHLCIVAVLLLTAAAAHAQVATKKQVSQWRTQMRQALFIPNPLPAVQPESYGTFTPAPGIVAERVSYRSEYGLRIPAVIYSPAAKPKSKQPAIIVVNGHGGDKSSWYAYYTGVLYARAGAVVLTYDPIGEGERNDDHKYATS